MKTYKTLVAIIGMVALLATSSLNAQTPPSGGGGGGSTPPTLAVPDQLPISMDDLQARAWESVAQIGVYGQVESSIRATTNDQQQVWLPYEPMTGVVDIEEIFAIVKAQKLQFNVLYPNNSIGLGSGLYDKDGNNLIYANAWGNINPPENGVSENTLDLEYNMNDSVWIPFTNATYFRIVERDANGNPVRYYHSSQYDVQNGMIRFFAYFSDKGGEIIVGLEDGTEVAYGLGNRGQRIIPTTVLLSIGNVSALGTRTFRTPMLGYNLVEVLIKPKEFEQNINPLSQLIVGGEKEAQIYFVAYWINAVGEESFATSVHVWRQGQPSSSGMQYKIDPSSHTMRDYFAPGHYWVKFTFDGWPIGNQFYPPWQGGSSGGGTVPAIQ